LKPELEMSHNSTDGSLDSNQSSIMDQQNHIKLRVELFQFERTTMEVHLENYLEKIQRQHPEFVHEQFKVLQHHDMLSFVLLGEISHAPAFSFQTISVQLIQQVNPSRVFFTATLVDQEIQFPNATYVLYHDTPGICSTILKLDSKDGFLTTPPLGLMAQNQKVVSQFSVSILLENLSFSTTPFQDYTPVEIKKGCLYFPLKPNHHQGQNPVQQTHIYNHMPMFPNPPPTLDPPRLVRNDLNTSVQWNTHQQSYVTRDRERSDLVKQVRSRLGRNDTSAGAPASHQENVSNHQPANVPPPSIVPKPPTRPVIGSLQPEPGIQQSSDNLQVKKATTEKPAQLNPQMRRGFLNANQPDHTAVPIGPPAFDQTTVFPGIVANIPSDDQGAAGGTNVVQRTQRYEDNNQESQPLLTFNIPSFNTGNRSEQNVRMNDPRFNPYRDLEVQMAWDNFNLNSDHLNSDVSVYLPARTGTDNHFVPYPLAESAPKYPQLPSVENSPYGSYPNKVSAIDQAKPVTPPSQTGKTQAKPVTPPVQTGNLGPPTTPPPVVPQSLQIVPTTVDGLTTPTLTMSQPATNVPIPNLMLPGTRPKDNSGQPPPPISDRDRVTRSSTGQSRQYGQELVNVGKNFMKSKNNKKEKKNSRSASED
jgi:hypothetical protein